MSVERSLRLIAGAFVTLSVALGYWLSPRWYLFTAFVGLNLLQSGFTDWCPMKSLLEAWKGRRPVRQADRPEVSRGALG